MSKLSAYGIRGNIYNWIKQWLENRKQRVVVNGHFSDWSHVCSGVPQGSVLGPQLFNIYINDIENNIRSKLVKFADDTKVGKVVNNIEQAKEFQSDLDEFSNWSKDWLMEFNYEKCVCLHLGKKNNNFDYHLNNLPLKSVNKEKDLGIIIDKNFNFSEQCAAAVKKANQMLGIIKRKIKNKTKEIIVGLYKALVRPHLEYCIQVWSPSLKGDIKAMEGVQKRALKLITQFKNINYSERLKRSNIISLEKRRLRGDLIQMFKMSRDLENFRKMFHISNNTFLRGNSMKLFKTRCRLNIRKNFFNQRVIDKWNKLPNNVLQSNTVNTFKNSLDTCAFFVNYEVS
jgi:hypothetical protein